MLWFKHILALPKYFRLKQIFFRNCRHILWFENLKSKQNGNTIQIVKTAIFNFRSRWWNEDIVEGISNSWFLGSFEWWHVCNLWWYAKRHFSIFNPYCLLGSESTPKFWHFTMMYIITHRPPPFHQQCRQNSGKILPICNMTVWVGKKLFRILKWL